MQRSRFDVVPLFSGGDAVAGEASGWGGPADARGGGDVLSAVYNPLEDPAGTTPLPSEIGTAAPATAPMPSPAAGFDAPTVGAGLVAAQAPDTSAGALDLALADRMIDLYGRAFGQQASVGSAASAAPLVVRSVPPTVAAAPDAGGGVRWARVAAFALVAVVVVLAARHGPALWAHLFAHHGHAPEGGADA